MRVFATESLLQMEAFFREVTKVNAMPPLDPELWRAHGMELVEPPFAVA